MGTPFLTVFTDLGVPLQPRDACSKDEIATAEHRLGVRVPRSIREYFALAGREKRLNHAHNHILAPSEWFLDAGHLVYLTENQDVVVWGSRVPALDDDPPVRQGVCGDAIEWHDEHQSSTEFLVVMLHWQAVMGGLGQTWSASVSATFGDKLSDWHRAGSVNEMQAYRRDGTALCWLPWEDGWRIFVSGLDDVKTRRLAQQLSLEWDPDYGDAL